MRSLKSIYKSIFAVFMLTFISAALLTSLCPEDSKAQTELLKKKDSLVAGDTIVKRTPGGEYSDGAFTVRSVLIGDTLKPQVQYGTSSEWVTTSVKNIRTQTSDTSIIITASSWPVDFTFNDPCVVGFRLVSLAPAYIATRKTYVDFRFRRR